jgi:hypothetical protein
VVERRTVNPLVGGSNPSSGAIFIIMNKYIIDFQIGAASDKALVLHTNSSTEDSSKPFSFEELKVMAEDDAELLIELERFRSLYPYILSLLSLLPSI